MMLAKVFDDGRDQIVQLPEECRFDEDEVMIDKIGDIVILMPKENNRYEKISAKDGNSML